MNKVIRLDGNPREPESVIVEFPGGSVEVARTTDGDYWAHIAVFHADHPHGYSAPGRLVDARVDRFDHHAKEDIPLADGLRVKNVNHVALRIAPVGKAVTS